MAQSITLASGATLIVPDTAVDTNVVTQPTGLATSGVVALVGEADEGPSWSQDLAAGTKLSSNSFSVGDINRVIAKYGSGRLVDAFKAILAPSLSPRVAGGPNRIVLVKTNNSDKAALTTPDQHTTFTAKRAGDAGNQIQASILTVQAEVAPTTGQFSYAPISNPATLALRTNGSSLSTEAIVANTTPSDLAEQLNQNIETLNTSGGQELNPISGLLMTDTLELAVVSGQDVKISLASPDTFTKAPSVGDTLHIPVGSTIVGGASANAGWYIVTGVANSTSSAYILAKKVTAGAPVAVAASAISGTPSNDLQAYASLKIDQMTGTDKDILAGLTGENITAAALGSTLTLTLATPNVWAATPAVNDSVRIPLTSVVAGAGSANVGWYKVTSFTNGVTSATLQLQKLSSIAPVSVATTAIVLSDDVVCLDPQIAGLGKSMELLDGGNTASLSSIFFQLGTNTAASWIGALTTSSAELKKQVTIKKSGEVNDEQSTVGGNVRFTIGYKGSTASMTIGVLSGTLKLQTTVTGGDGGNLDMDLSKIASLADLVSKINAQPGYSSAVSNTSDGQKNPSILDKGTYEIATGTAARKPARIKSDVQELKSIASTLVAIEPIQTAGLPAEMTVKFLTGGAKGGSTGLQMTQAVDALQSVRTNFIVPLVSQDASADIAEGETESSSTYTVDAVNAAVKSHCTAMSTAKIKRHRLGAVSKRGTFQEAKDSALNIASYRIAHTFQDVFNLNSQGEIKQFQPWMGASLVAGFQAAAGYKSIFNKAVNVSGATQAAGDFDDENYSSVEDATIAGLVVLQKQDTGGFNFVSDQTTYGLDNNFVYNSFQAIYVADLMAVTLAESLKKAFVGESVADVTVGGMTSFIKGKMAEFLKAKYIVGSEQQGAPGGWKTINVKIEGSVAYVEVTVIEATSIKFIPINLNIEGVKASTAA